MDDMRWFRARDHINELLAEAASNRLAHAGRPDGRQKGPMAPARPARAAELGDRVKRSPGDVRIRERRLEGDRC